MWAGFFSFEEQLLVPKLIKKKELEIAILTGKSSTSSVGHILVSFKKLSTLLGSVIVGVYD